jgi:chromosome partitioning protein
MFIIAVIGQKGGTGKTTIATGLAAVAAEAGQAVALLDLDPQTNAANWKDRREAGNPAVLPTPIGRLRQAMEAATASDADLIIIDTPGKADNIAIAAAKVADVVLVPIAPQIFELETLQSVRELVGMAGDPPAFVVLNEMHPSATRAVKDAKAVVGNTSSLQVCPVHICSRDIYATAPAEGKAPNEIEPRGKAAQELRQLYKFISELTEKSDSKLTGKSESGLHAKRKQAGQSAKRA